MKKEFLYICDKCQNEISSKDESIIICNVCGNKIDTRITAWSNQNPRRHYNKSNNWYFALFLILVFSSVRYCIRQDDRKAREQGKEMAKLLNYASKTEDYKIETYIKLTEKPTFLPIFKILSKVSNTSLKSGDDKGLIIKLISYKSTDSKYSDIKNSRDSIIKNYFMTLGDSVIIRNETSISPIVRYNSLLTNGYLMKAKVKFDFNILSDYDSIKNKNWHLILFNKPDKESIKEADKIIKSRQFEKDEVYLVE